MGDLIVISDTDVLARVLIHLNEAIIRHESIGETRYSEELRERAKFVESRLDKERHGTKKRRV